MRCTYACGSQEHLSARRRFLGQLGVGIAAGGIAALTSPSATAALQQKERKVVVFNMAGGLSQLESWDPKPGAETGGPFRAIPTSVPGVHISELLPMTASQMHHLCLCRGVNTSEDDHGKGNFMMLTGRRQTGAVDYPVIGAVAARMLSDTTTVLPGHLQITPGGGGGRGNDSAYLGPKYASIVLGNGNPPAHTDRPQGISEQSEAARHAFRAKADQRFLTRARSAMSDVYTGSFEQAQRLMAERDAFDVTKESTVDQERYGSFDLGRHCLLARRLLQRGATFVQITHTNYDTHNENFAFHIEQLGEFDRAFSTFITDLATLGLLEHTLVVVLSEFGRTPNINLYHGRDHWSKAWSVVLAGAGVKRGCVFGATNDKGTEVTEGQVDHGQLFHTYLQAVGVDSRNDLVVDGRELPLADPTVEPIWDVLV